MKYEQKKNDNLEFSHLFTYFASESSRKLWLFFAVLVPSEIRFVILHFILSAAITLTFFDRLLVLSWKVIMVINKVFSHHTNYLKLMCNALITPTPKLDFLFRHVFDNLTYWKGFKTCNTVTHCCWCYSQFTIFFSKIT